MHLRKIIFASILLAVVAFAQQPQDGPFQIKYAANLDKGEAYINVVNDGANGASQYGPGINGDVGAICVNVYAFSPDEQMVSCCSCPVTANGVMNLGANRDLVSNTLTAFNPTSITIKLLATLATGGKCENTARSEGRIVPGMLAWGTSVHAQNILPAGPNGWATTETPFIQGSLSDAELLRLRTMCTMMYANGSKFGICKSCQLGALGAAKR